MLRRLLIVSLALGALWAAPAHATSFCGTPAPGDRTPQLFGGPQVHAVYAIPADGTDQLAQYADAIETNSESIDAWWRGQDATRTPRFDLYPFACGPQVDLVDVRLTVLGAALPTAASAFGQAWSDLSRLGLVSETDVSLVYYDGPTLSDNLCGVGGGGNGNGGPGLAVVIIHACEGLDSARIAAHELAHAFGAVANGAPHLCGNSAHTCDDPSDLMYPYVDGTLAQAILDPGRDDYYAHSGGWTDVQDSPYLRHLDAQVRFGLTIIGGGRVRSDPAGVDCTASCSQQWDRGTETTLEPLPADGMRFVRWRGACSGEDYCDLRLDSDEDATAFFAPAFFRLTVVVSGRGRVTSAVPELSCRARCHAPAESYAAVRLVARPAKGWRLKAWAGACRGARRSCSVPMKSATTARAVFVRRG